MALRLDEAEEEPTVINMVDVFLRLVPIRDHACDDEQRGNTC
jgi:hypothetical protein